MLPRFILDAARPCLALGLAAISGSAMAQTPPPAAEQAWRNANDSVGQFRRGHADLLKWEQGQPQPAAEPAPAAAGFALASAEQAVRQAWRAHRELARPLARLGSGNADRIAMGRWLEIDPSLTWRIEDLAEVLDVAAQARKAWTDAVASRQVLQPLGRALETAEAADELGQRMVSVGNWSRLQQTPLQLARSNARMNLHRAQYAAAQAQARLLKTLELTGIEPAVGLPDQLPDSTAEALPAPEFQRRLAAIESELPWGQRARQRGNAQLAFAAYQASHALARGARDEVLKVRELITEETVLHYNGMLKSTWDLLGEAQSQSQAAASAIAAQRDFEIARIDLEWVLLGGEPESWVSLGAGAGAPAAPAGH